ncbi:thioredoxin family protein [Meridianimarinicoccus aquatilis]|uniref:Thioredoxin n=1 Tax=Meridianimarinicoccus aquatilis TaxID=2552766 RepID=A0A4V6PPH7_9RHOB|nr:thioredoxin family protein [Fluviibacterium aquatile]TDL90739.1 thioredoxin [Fluviibacterium aquatile]
MKRILILCGTLLALAIPAGAANVGDDGLHKTSWMRETFLDLREDLAEANAEGKRMAIIFEQRGCIYCEKMHKEVFPRPEIESYINDNYFVVQLNLHGALEVTDFDGEVLSERQAARKWGMLFTPTMIFLPQEVPDDVAAAQASVAMMPGAFGAQTTLDMLTWVVEKRYEIEDGEDFQRYHARRISERESEKKQ